MKKKILFVVYAIEKKPSGGHYYSLIATVNLLSRFYNCQIINLGLAYNEALRDSPLDTKFLYIDKLNYYPMVLKLKKMIEQLNPDIIHAFDINALRFVRSVNNYKSPVIFTKCGGANINKNIPMADEYICYSQENFDFFLKYKKNDADVHLIPQRVLEVPKDQDRITKLIDAYQLYNSDIVLRISRFSKMHEQSIIQSINLFRVYSAINAKAKLLLIGAVQDEQVLANIRSLVNGLDVHIINDPIYCLNAAELIDLATIVIGTGRGAMEACSLGKVVFCPIEGAEFPAPLIADTYSALSKYNFSARAKLAKISEEVIIEILANNLDELRSFSQYCFDKHFNLASPDVINSYKEIYQNARIYKRNKQYWWNYIYDMCLFFKPAFLNKSFFRLK